MYGNTACFAILFSKEINATELCPEIEKQFEFFKRTTIQDIGVVEKDNLVEILRNEVQALCILNTKKKVREIYQELEGEGVYHLSTYMYPLHRRRVINEIKQRLSRNENCIVISTSLVEAGVDLDFKSVYRELAGIDSLIQAAGRCNREGKKPLEESRVYVFKFDDEKIVPGQSQQIEAAKYVMETETDVTSRQAIKRYFETLYHYRGDSLDKKDIMGQFGKGNYPFATVSKQFKLIEENTKSIFIAKEEAAELLLQEIRKKGMTRQLMRKAGKYMISVREREFEEMSAMGMLIPVVAEMKEDFFVLRDSGMYTWEMGIEMERTIIM